MSNLKNNTISGVFWTFTQQFSVQIINFSVQIILARLLLPEAFGLIAMLQIFIAIGSSLADSGMTSSLIRTINPTQKDYSTVFFTNLFASILIYILLFFSAPLIAIFYDSPLLGEVIRVYTLSFIIGSLVGVQTTRLTKAMKFKLQMYMQLPSVLIGGLAGIIMAYRGYGVWSLVFLNLIQSSLFMLQHWFRSKWRPSFVIDLQCLKYHFGFGYKLSIGSLLNAIYDNIYSVIIGKYFSPVLLGFYNRAELFQFFPGKNLSAALEKVTYPMFASIQEDNVLLKRAYKKLFQQIMFWLAPLMITLCVIAEPLFRFVLTDKWLPIVPYFQILTVAGILHPFQRYNLNILKVKGRTDLVLKLNIIKKITLTIAIAIAIPFGITAMVIAQSVFSLFSVYFNTYFSGKLINYPLKEQIKDLAPTILISILAGLIVLVEDRLLLHNNSDLFRIISGSILSTVFYLGVSHFFKLSPLQDVRSIIKSKLFKKSIENVNKKVTVKSLK